MFYFEANINKIKHKTQIKKQKQIDPKQPLNLPNQFHNHNQQTQEIQFFFGNIPPMTENATQDPKCMQNMEN